MKYLQSLQTGHRLNKSLGGPRGQVVKSADISLPLNHSIISPLYSRPIRGTCETSQDLTAGVPGGFSRGSPVFAQSTDLSVSYELKFLCCLHLMCVFKFLVKFG